MYIVNGEVHTERSPLSFFFNDTATAEIYTLSLHDALPISGTGENVGPDARHVGGRRAAVERASPGPADVEERQPRPALGDRKSTRLNSSHANISYAVFCLKKKKQAPSSILAFQLL